jgi:hypothetical protein
MTVPDDAAVRKFLKELEEDAVEYFDGGRENHLWDIGLTISAIVTSLIAATIAAADVPRWIRVGIAAVPAACTSIQKVLEVRARSNWYFNYATRYRALGTTLEHASSPNLEEFAKKKNGIDLDMERTWGQIGRGGVKPSPKGD